MATKKTTGKKLADMMYGNPEGAAFGITPMIGKRREDRQDREAAKSFPVDLARGVVAGAVGMPGDIESLIRMLPGLNEKTVLPTSEDVLKRIPFGTDTPAGQFASGLGTLAGGSANIGAAPRMVKQGALAAGRAGERMAERVVPQIMERGGAGADVLSGLAQGSQSRIFIGPKAKTFHKGKADMAVALEEAGRTPQEIWLATGTFRGADGILRQEIDDRAAKLILPDEQQDRVAALKGRVGEMKESIKPIPQKDLFPKALTEAKKGVRSSIDALKEEISGRSKNARTQGIDAQYAFEHPELYEAYPELKGLNITMGGREGTAQGASGALTVSSKTGNSPGYMEMDMYNRGLMSKNPTSVALHEMQHAVQTLEGMGPGGSPTVAFQNPEAFEILKQIRKEAYKPVSMQEFQKSNKYPDAEVQDRYVEYLNQLRDGANANPVIERALQERAAMEYYKRLAGEAEARAVQERQMMTPAQRMETPPPASYDVPQEDLIVKPPREYADGGAVIRATPQSRITGPVANALRKAQQFAGQYEIDPRIPLLGGTGIDELFGLPDAASLMEDVSYNGPGALVRGGNAVSGGMGTFRQDPRLLTALDVGATATGVGKLGLSAAKAAPGALAAGARNLSTPRALNPQAGIVSTDLARKLSTARSLPQSETFRQAVSNTPGASITEEGLQMPLQRGQKIEQEMAPSVRGGVFYLPKGAAQGKHYSKDSGAYGGSKKVTGETSIANPLFVKGATGGKSPEQAYIELMGKDAFKALQDELMGVMSYGNKNVRADVSSFLSRYAPELEDYADYIVDNSKQGNQLRYALQEAAIGSAARNAGHDAIVGYSKKKTGEPFISEVFDVREVNYPSQNIEPEVFEKFTQPSQPVHFSDNPDVMQLELAGGGAVNMAAGGIAKLAKLARAPAKSKEEISKIAERLAPQVTGEYVRKDAKTAKTVADKTQKQFQREKTLPVDVRPTGEERVPKLVDIEKLKGEVMIGIPGDPTLTGKSLYGVGDVKLGSPSPQHGGPQYGLYSDDAFWASGLGAARRVQNLAKEAGEQYDAPVSGKYIMMGPDSINYAQHFADANLQAIDLSKMTKRQIEQFNKLIRFGNPNSGPRPSFPGIEDKESAYLHMAMDPELRKHFNELMQKNTVTEALNLPSGNDIRFAITEPSLRDLETGVTGFSIGRMRPEISSKDLPLSTHPTYTHDIPGEFMGQSRFPIPYELSFPDTLKSIRENPAQAPHEFGSLKMVGPRQTIDQQMIDEIKAYEERMKQLTGKKAGGAVRKAEGGEITADDLILEERKL